MFSILFSSKKRNGQPFLLSATHVTFAVGLDGIALSPDGKWLYYASMSHDSLYRVETKHLLDQGRTRAQLEKDIQFVSKKPLSDGIAFDAKGNLFLTDVEAGRGLSVLQPNGKMRTFFRDERVVWADCVHVANDGTIYMTDSAIPAYLDPLMRPPTKATLQSAGPYRIYVLPALHK
jgi:sugar lactone lactonase YvrE